MTVIEMAYGVLVRVDEEDNEYVLRVLDLPEIISRHDRDETSEEELFELAEDAILTALQARIETQDEIPPPTDVAGAAFWVPLDPLAVLKLTLYEEIRQAKMSRRELAKRLDRNEVLVRRMLDLQHPSQVKQLKQALAVFGKRFVLSARAKPSKDCGLAA